MQIEIRNGPSFGIARVTLPPNGSLRAEAGAMMAMSADVRLEAQMKGGLGKALKRSVLGGESFFVSTYTAGPNGGFVDLGATLPGEVTVLDVAPGANWVIQRGSWMGSPESVEIDAKWGGFKSLAGGEGGFMVHATGQGPVIIGCYGALETWDLGPNDSVVVDTGHMVAFQESVTYSLRKAAEGVMNSAKSGEGFVFEFRGPGRVLVQTRNPSELTRWLGAQLSGYGSAGGENSGLLGMLR